MIFRRSVLQWTCPLAVAALTLACIELPSSPTLESSASSELPVAVGHGYPASSDRIVVEGFSLPESVLHDEEADVYLVSNMGEGANPLLLDDNGFISRVSPSGEILDLKWIDGADPGTELHGPFGMALRGDVLFVVDRNALRAFDRGTGAPLGEVATFPYAFPFSPGSVGMLNDVCLGSGGVMYVTDTGLTAGASGFEPVPTDAIYRIADGASSRVVAGEATGGPNGCLVTGSNVLWTTMKSNRILRTNPAGSVDEVVSLPFGGQIDGIARTGGHLFVTSWESGQVLSTDLGGGQASVAFEGMATPGDLSVDRTRNRLLVPLVMQNQIVLQPM